MIFAQKIGATKIYFLPMQGDFKLYANFFIQRLSHKQKSPVFGGAFF